MTKLCAEHIEIGKQYMFVDNFLRVNFRVEVLSERERNAGWYKVRALEQYNSRHLPVLVSSLDLDLIAPGEE